MSRERTVFAMAGSPVARFAPFADAEPITEQTNRRNALLQEDASRSFHFEKPGLFRVSLLKLSEKQYTISIAVHHIIADEWSLDVLFREVLFRLDEHQGDEPPDEAPHRDALQKGRRARPQRRLFLRTESQLCDAANAQHVQAFDAVLHGGWHETGWSGG